MTYEIWETTSNNLLADFDSQAEALALVRRSVDAHGPAAVCSWTLLFEDDDETVHPVAAGEDLVRLAADFDAPAHQSTQRKTG